MNPADFTDAAPPPPPRFGTYAVCDWLPAERRWRVSLTAEGQAAARQLLASDPRPAAMLRRRMPWLYETLVDTGAFHDPVHDLHSAAVLAVVRAVSRYDAAREPEPERRATLRTFALVAVTNDLLNWFYRDKRRTRRRYVPGDPALVADLPARPGPDPVAEWDARVAVAAVFRRLRPRQRLVLAMRHGLDGGGGMTLQEVGDRVGLSKERVRQIEAKAFAAARASAAALGWDGGRS